MGYLANIIHDARRHGIVGSFTSLSQGKVVGSENGFSDGDAAEVVAPIRLQSSDLQQVDVMRTLLESDNLSRSVRRDINKQGAKPVGALSWGQALQDGINPLTSIQSQESSLHTGVDGHGEAMAGSQRMTALSTDLSLSDEMRNIVSRPHAIRESTPGVSPQLPPQVSAGDSIPVHRNFLPPLSGRVEAREYPDTPPVAPAVARKPANLPADAPTLDSQDTQKAKSPTTNLPPLILEARESSPFRSPGGRQALQSPIELEPSEARIWPQDSTAAQVTHTRAVEPSVHIGRIEVVILAPEPSRQSNLPVSSAGGMVSRQYLRRL
ncbi:MAG: hypothetical protein KKD63_02085 [Proteobacteria bacterium]|nr:hypothetical protein [Desulfobulbaceae bacterium]MBU4151650.1 hypothetical protein [Pseudomonadota bacterium]